MRSATRPFGIVGVVDHCGELEDAVLDGAERSLLLLASRCDDRLLGGPAAEAFDPVRIHVAAANVAGQGGEIVDDVREASLDGGPGHLRLEFGREVIRNRVRKEEGFGRPS